MSDQTVPPKATAIYSIQAYSHHHEAAISHRSVSLDRISPSVWISLRRSQEMRITVPIMATLKTSPTRKIKHNTQTIIKANTQRKITPRINRAKAQMLAEDRSSSSSAPRWILQQEVEGRARRTRICMTKVPTYLVFPFLELFFSQTFGYKSKKLTSSRNWFHPRKVPQSRTSRQRVCCGASQGRENQRLHQGQI